MIPNWPAAMPCVVRYASIAAPLMVCFLHAATGPAKSWDIAPRWN